MIYKTQHRQLKIVQHEPHQKPGITAGATEECQQFLFHQWRNERGNDRITITTKGIYPWPFVTLTFWQINMSTDTLCPVVNLIVRKIRKTRDSNIHCLMYSLRKSFLDKVSSRVVCGDSWCMRQSKHIVIFFVFRQFQLFYSWLSNFLLKSSLKKLNT